MALFFAVVLVLSMVFATPAAAWADEGAQAGLGASTESTISADATEGTITPDASSLTVVANQQIDVSACVDAVANGDWHFDFAISSTAASGVAAINKHTGILTGLAAGTTEVTVYLTPGLAPTGNPNNPCFAALDSVAIAITVTAPLETGVYVPGSTFQGLNQTLTMNSPAFDAFAIAKDASGVVTGYTNTGATGTVGSTLDFNFTMSNGIGNDFGIWAGNNVGNITLTAPDGTQYVYGTDSSLVLSRGISNTNIDLVVDSSVLTQTGTYTLTFTSDFSAGNFNNLPLRTLEAPIDFEFVLS